MFKYVFLIDFLHKAPIFPITQNAIKSLSGVLLSITFLIIFLGLSIYKCLQYNKNYTVSFSKNFIKREEVNKVNITFGFKIENQWNKDVIIKLFNSNNEILDTSHQKYCYENLTEIQNNKIYENNYTCFINYKINTSNITNHFLKLHLIYIGEKNEYNKNERIPLFVRFKEPIIKHGSRNPFYYPDISELRYFYQLEYTTVNRKNVMTIYYISEGLFSKKKMSTAYLEDYDDFSISNQIQKKEYNGDYIGSFRFGISKKQDTFHRKYATFITFISELGGQFISIMGFFSFLSIIFINFTDNLRIFNSFIEKNPSLTKQATEIIEYYWIKNHGKKFQNKEEIKNIGREEKIKYFFNKFNRCKKKDPKIEKLNAINEFMNTLEIDNYLQSKFFQEIKIKRIREILNEIRIEKPNLDEITLKTEFFSKGNYNIIEKNEYELIINLILDEEKLDTKNENQSTIEVKNDINSSKSEPFKEQKSNFISLKEETSNNISETNQTITNEMGILYKSIH